MDLRSRILQLRKLRDLSGFPGERLAADRVLKILFLKYKGTAELAQALAHPGISSVADKWADEWEDDSILLTYTHASHDQWNAPEGGPRRRVGFFSSRPMAVERRLVCIEPAPKTRRCDYILTSVEIVGLDGKLRHACVGGRRALLLAYGDDVVLPGERVEVSAMRNPGMAGVGASPLGVRARFRVPRPELESASGSESETAHAAGRS